MTYSSTRVYIHNIHETRDFLREQMEGMAIGSMHEVAGWQRKRQSRRCRKRRDIIQAGVGSRHGSTFISREILRGSRPRGNIYVLYSVREKRREEEYRWIFFFFYFAFLDEAFSTAALDEHWNKDGGEAPSGEPSSSQDRERHRKMRKKRRQKCYD